MSTWERIERKKLQGRERRARQYRPDDRPGTGRPAATSLSSVLGMVSYMAHNRSIERFFAAEVIGRVMQGPGWADTLLIWTYDEHGGYYDHASPPAAVPPDDLPGHSRVAHPSLARSLLKVLFPGYVRHAEQLVGGPGCLRHLRGSGYPP